MKPNHNQESKTSPFDSLRKTVLFLYIMLLPILVLGKQRNIDGIYVEKDFGDTIEISNGTFYLKKFNNNHLSLYYSNTLAICDIKRLDNHIIEISNQQLFNKYEEDVNVSFLNDERDSTINDSILVKFDIPYNHTIPLLISIYTESETITCGNARETYIPASTKTIQCLVRPLWYTSTTIYNTYDGCLYYTSPTLEIKHPCKRIDISMHSLDNTAFERYYIVSEYIYIKRNCLYWRGECYKRI